MNTPTYVPRPATPSDYRSLAASLSHQHLVHRHLDWRHSLDWLDQQPFWVLEHEQEIVAALACPPDPPDVAWIRLFFTSPQVSPQLAWELLFPQARQMLASQPNVRFAAVALYPWFATLLEHNGFQKCHDIVTLAWENAQIPDLPAPPGIVIRPIDIVDVNDLTDVDRSSFESLWVNSYEAVEAAYMQCAYGTLAERDGQIIGFQISTGNPFAAHLARLAIMPGYQGQGIGAALVQDMLRYFSQRRVWQVTVNTQSTNEVSLHLYQKLGFHFTGENFPVFILPNS